MPQTSQRRRLVQLLEISALFKEVFDSDSEGDDTDTSDDDLFLDNPTDLLGLVSASRYLSPRPRMATTYYWLEEGLDSLDDKRYRHQFRISREAFDFILDKIASNPIFANNSPNEQLPVKHQLHIALWRFGRFGNGASTIDVSKKFSIGEGTVQKITDRVVAAILALQGEYLSWYSSPNDLARMKSRIYESSGFPNCVGFLDGTTVVLAEKPVHDGELYYNRKGEYGINCQIVADLDARIRFLFAGYPASIHDSRSIQNSDLSKDPGTFFGEGEYVLADSAYALTNTIIPTFKKPASLQQDNATFNKIHSSLRVKVEHCIGMLKGRFQSLRGLRLRVDRKRDADRVVAWLMACAILHNMLLDMDHWDVDDDSEEEAEANPLSEESNQQLPAAMYREVIKSQVLAFSY
jgi:DDE superfamily endonuclease